MIRIIGIALVILGLIAQPLIAAMPAAQHLGEASSSISAGDVVPVIGDRVMSHSGGTDQSSQRPCHESAAENVAVQSETASDNKPDVSPCINCDSDCVNGSCASACSPNTVAVLNQTPIDLEHLSSVRIVGTGGALVQDLHVRIFHPPKHA